MIWRRDDPDSIQKTFFLKHPMRTDDPWLIALLEASRYGRETWEMYCFNHGLPTRNPGSWLLGIERPACNNDTCASLAANVWPLMWERSRGALQNLSLRQELECAVCTKERERRRCVFRNTDEDRCSYVQEPFMAAPYVHPFRHPSYHAT